MKKHLLALRQQLPKFIAVFSILVGLSVMLGWYLDVAFLKSIVPGVITMKFTTALCFVCAGVILFFISRHLVNPSDISGMFILFGSLIIFILMGTMLFASFFHINTGLSNLFIREIDIVTGVPGLPSLGTMLSFFIIAICGVMVVKNSIKHRSVIYTGGILVGVIGLVALVGYFIHYPLLYWSFSNTSNAMAIHTAFLFVLLGIGFVLLPLEEIQNKIENHFSIKMRLRWSLFVFTFLPVLLSSMILISTLKVQISTDAVNHLETISYIQEKRINEVIRQYQVMAEGISSRIQFKQELIAVNDTNNLNAHNIALHNILKAALEPLDEIKEVALFDDTDKLLLITPQKDKYDEYISFAKRFTGRTSAVMKIKNEYSFYVIEPIKDKDKIIGTLVLNFGPQLFENVAEDHTGLGETGEMLLAFKNENGDVDFLTEVLSPQKRRIIKSTETEVPVVQALIYKQNTTFESNADYRGVPVIAVTKYLDKLDWGFVVKMDTKEIFSKIKEIELTTMIISSIVILFSMITSHFISSRFE